MPLITAICWLFGYWLYHICTTDDLHSTFKKMWGARIVSFCSIIYISVFMFMLEWCVLSLFVVIFHTYIFIMYAIDGHRLTNTFRQQYYEEYKNNLKST